MVGSIKTNAPSTYAGLWKKLGETVGYIWKHHPNFDWYLKVDDETLVLMESLKAFLADQNTNPKHPAICGRPLEAPLTVAGMLSSPSYFGNPTNADFGRKFMERVPGLEGDTKIVYPQGGAGYFMNRRYFDQLKALMQSKNNFVAGAPPEDEAQGVMAMYQGINLTITRDTRGRDYQHWESPGLTFYHHDTRRPHSDATDFAVRCPHPYAWSSLLLPIINQFSGRTSPGGPLQNTIHMPQTILS